VNLHRKKKTCGVIGCWKSKGGTVVTVDGRNPAPVEVGSFSHYLQGFIHSRFQVVQESTVQPPED